MQSHQFGMDELLAGLEDVSERAGVIDAHRFLLSGTPEDISNKLLVPASTLVSDSLHLVQEMEAHVSTCSGAEDVADEKAERLREICFAGRIELSEAQQRLHAIATAEREVKLAICDSVCRKARRIAGMMLDAARSASGRPLPGGQSETKLTDAIAVRRAYGKLRRCVNVVDIRNEWSQYESLSQVSTMMEQMLANTALGIRVQDRTLFLSLQYRLTKWLRIEPRQRPDAKQLYEDLKTTCSLLLAINLRQELREHDGKLLEYVSAVLAKNELGQEDLQELILRLRALEGFDDELDELVERMRRGGEPEGVLAALDRILCRWRPDPVERARERPTCA